MSLSSASILARWLSCSVMNLIDSGRPKIAASANTTGATPPDIKQHLPAVPRHQRRAGEAGERAADRHHAGRDDGERGAPVARRRFGVNGYHTGNNSADVETGEEAQPRQFGEIGRIGSGEGEHAEQKICEDQGRLAAVTIADPTKNLRTEQHAEIAGAEHHAEVLRRDVPFLDETRRRKGDGADVVAVDKGNDGGPDDQLDVERAHSILVEEVRDLNVCRRRHCSSRKACMRDTVEDAQCAIELPLLIATSASNSRQRRPWSPPASLP